MQKSWANNVDFVNQKTGRDPVIGQKGGSDSQAQEWIAVWGEPETKPFDFGEFVTLKGGEFFFAPSIPFCEKPLSHWLLMKGARVKGNYSPLTPHHSPLTTD